MVTDDGGAYRRSGTAIFRCGNHLDAYFGSEGLVVIESIGAVMAETVVESEHEGLYAV